MLVSSKVVDQQVDQDPQQPGQQLRTQNRAQVTVVLTTKTMLLTAFIRTAHIKTQQCTPTLTGMLVQGAPLSHCTFITGQ